MSEDNWLVVSQAVPIRQLNEQGIERFRIYLSSAKAGATAPLPHELLADDSLSRILDRHVTVEQMSFVTTLEITRYLYPRIEALQLPGKYYDPGLWAWLIVYYFELICPANIFNQRKIGEIARYIPPRNRNFDESNRHLLALPIRMYERHGEGRTKLLLSSMPNEQSFTLNLVSRSQELSTNPAILDALAKLYWDDQRQIPKRGFGGIGKPGTLRRFMALMNQFNRTFDLFTMSGDQIINLLPQNEFARWLS